MVHIVLIVLGDTGRSPRMQYHSISLSNLNEVKNITLIGYKGEKCNEIINNNNKIKDKRISVSNKFIESLRFIAILHAIVKGFYFVFTLIYTLFQLPHIDLILIQNPPSIPAAIASLILSYFTGTVILIDWHNLGFSLYLDRYKESHILVVLSKYLEGFICSFCHRHICVSKAMSEWLKKTYLIESTVLYDRPPSSVFTKFDSFVKQTSSTHTDNLNTNINNQNDNDNEKINDTKNSTSSTLTTRTVPLIPINIRHNLLIKLGLTDELLFPFHPTTISHSSSNQLLELETSSPSSPSPSTSLSEYCQREFPSNIPFVPVNLDPSLIVEKTIQTIKYKSSNNSNEVLTGMRRDRSVLLISSTSWSPDEDFSILMKGLQNLDKSLVKRRSEGRSKDRTRIVVVITGKGPLKEQFMKEWYELQNNEKERLSYISLTCLWLDISDYPILLSCCDLGICLHTSSSGLDLPMKILDMYGAGLPVLAYYYPTIFELVKNGENGILFRSSSELSAHLYRLYCDSPYDIRTNEEFNKMKKIVYQIDDWESNWNKVMIPIVQDCLKLHQKLYQQSNHLFLGSFKLSLLILVFMIGIGIYLSL